MKMNFDISMQQTQKLVMTQQLQIAIKLLQMPALELNEYIQEQLDDNPMLEVSSNEKQLDENKIDWKEYVKNYDSNEYKEDNGEYEENASPLNFIPSVTTLRDHLMFQLHISVNSEEEILIGEYLIDNIDSGGYLRVDVSDTAKYLGVSENKASYMMNTIQSFDPSGVGARNLKECLIIQLREQGILSELLEKVVNNYLNEIGENKYGIIAKELSITSKEAQRIGDTIKGLEPKPGRGFADSYEVKYILPDVIVERIDGRYVVSVNDKMTPRLTINSYYRNILKNGVGEDETAEYVNKKMNAAAWLIKSIEQRKTTIYNVVSSIVSFQAEFLDKGMNYLKPLTLKDVAEDLGIHESTVSRAINGKYVQTPRGIYNLKFFFKRGLDANGGENVSSESIKNIIRNIIEVEDETKPLSDQKITDMLNNDGINVSRRTVAKYREEMNILPTSKRKRFL